MQKCKFAGVSDPESCRRNARLVVVSVVCGRCNICQPMVCGAFVEHLRSVCRAWQYYLLLFALICSGFAERGKFACCFLTVHMLDVASLVGSLVG